MISFRGNKPSKKWTLRSIDYYQHISSGQSRNDVALNQKPDLINKPYCIKHQKKTVQIIINM
jgi:hypothetical protein